MVFVITGVLLWVPALLGYGYLALWLATPGHRSNGAPLVLIAGLMGLAFVGTLANLAHFLVPLSPPITAMFLVGGWASLLVCFRARIISAPGWPQSVAAVCLLALLALVSREFVYWTQDSGLYHVPAIRWMTQHEIVRGLANLHVRLAMNSLWFSSAAALEIPGFEGKSSFLLNTILIFVWGLSLLGILWNIARSRVTASTLFVLCGGLVWLNVVNGARLNTPSPDVVGIPVALFTVFAAWRALESPDDWDQYTFLAGVIPLVGAAVKLSAAGLLLAPALLMSWLLATRPGRESWTRVLKVLQRLTLIGAVIFVPWVARNVIMSGTVIFPLKITRLDLPWAVPIADLEWLEGYVKAWARQPDTDYRVVLADWSWLTEWWLPHYSRDRVVLATAALVGLGVVLVCLTVVRERLTRSGFTRLGCLAAIPAFSMLFWFIQAPDIRHGEGSFWSLGLLCLTAGLWRFHRVYLSGPLQRMQPRVRRAIMVACVSIVILTAMHPRMRSWIRNPGELVTRLPGFVFEAPEVPTPNLDVVRTEDGVPIFRPQGGVCWNGPLPCTPFFSEKLKVELTNEPDHRFREFSYPPGTSWAESTGFF